ncbi:hypothetical protein Tco_1556907 [Tanacetum coccineum]
MTMRVQPHSVKVAEVMAMSDSTFRKRYRSSYETPSPSLTLPVWKRYKGTSELILDTNSEGDELGDEDTDEDEEDESSDADDEREGSEDEGLGLEGSEEEAVPNVEEDQVLSTFEIGQSSRSMPKQQGAKRVSAFSQPTLTSWVDPEDGRVYTDILAYVPPVAPVQTPPSSKWSSGSLPISPLSPIVPILVASLVATLIDTISIDEDKFIEIEAQLELYWVILQDHTQHLDALPPTLFADIDRDVREMYTRSGEVRDAIFSQRPVLVLEAWAGQTNAQRAALWHDIYDIQRENHYLRMQLTEERRERLELANRVAKMERRQECREEL